MNEIQWNDRFNIGVEVVDKAHRRLFSIVSKLISLNEEEEKQQYACREGIKYFKSYTMRHFAEEEAYMKSIGYEGYQIHKKLHDNMRDKTLPALEAEMEAENYSVESIQHFLGICVGWLNAHIMIEDRAITGRTEKKWVHRPTENEIESLKRAISQALGELFHVKAEIISEHYSGENFASNRALCYRLTYRSPENKRPMFVYLIYEERMILFMISNVLGKQIKKVDRTVSEAVKLLSQKFMNRLSSHFVLTGGYRLQKIDMMTFVQFAKVFDREKQYPPYSLLFSTEKKDYFVFCVKK